eukprot:COSAG01_NODE_8891_length_2625_cov_1.409343_5_plen_72_part_00
MGVCGGWAGARRGSAGGGGLGDDKLEGLLRESSAAIEMLEMERTRASQLQGARSSGTAVSTLLSVMHAVLC